MLCSAERTPAEPCGVSLRPGGLARASVYDRNDAGATSQPSPRRYNDCDQVAT